MAKENIIPLNAVAADAREFIRTFRENGSLSFQDIALDDARRNYRQSCKLNGIRVDAKLDVVDIDCPVSGGKIKLRLYSKDNRMRPLLLFLHGGGWVIGDLYTHDGICRFMAANTSYNVVAVDYRLAPEYTFPVPYLDCLEALNWLSDNQKQIMLNCAKTVVMGDSAGACMATILANETNVADNITIDAQILLYPVTDLTASSMSYNKIQEGFPLTDKSMYWFRRNYLTTQTDIKERRVSPLFFCENKQADMFIVTVGFDPLADEGCDYANRAAKAGTLLEHHHLPNHMHGIFTAAGKIETARWMLTKAAQFVEARQ
ncbi:alpha/beta hydrolase [uncultured Bartonella sp.]|uniref:alpha/beta hydrolase n=1 Tax=uncultured Bartonella sp. TaxID=104108 RepID=UPI00260A636D|nr:alpha/beta hydrolase [uncultured Bartonella sp.]